jgi:hypothetical protein
MGAKTERRLETTIPRPSGQLLGARINDARDKLTKLRRATVPSPDLNDRVELRIAALGAPTVRGIGAGEEL